MWTAFLNDLFQRIITLNKWEQRSHLELRLKDLNLPKNAKALDFGCGTALFAPTFIKAGFSYHGYDIDPELLRYAGRLYPKGAFFSSLEGASIQAPFDMILANCCFHHISDEQLSGEMSRIKNLLKPGGTFLFIDLLLRNDDHSWIRRAFRKLERGAYVRKGEDYLRIIEKQLQVKAQHTVRSHVFSIPGNPAYNDLIVLECVTH